ITLLVPMRRILKLESYITVHHFENLSKLMLTTSLIVGYAYMTEFFIAWYSGSPFEQGTFIDRMFGQYWGFSWMMFTCNVLIPLLLFSKAIRTNLTSLFVISIFVNIGMWLERFVIIMTSLSHDLDPANWAGVYRITWVETSITIGAFGLFFTLFLLFVKNFPAVSITELKETMERPAEADPATAWPEPV
ncbi:MAG: hypothetical protein QGG89_00250, partial [Vicinamibacterales bacterium]|nr:hypothetical protein [Vicinamibacterales bacterium]